MIHYENWFQLSILDYECNVFIKYVISLNYYLRIDIDEFKDGVCTRRLMIEAVRYKLKDMV